MGIPEFQGQFQQNPQMARQPGMQQQAFQPPPRSTAAPPPRTTLPPPPTSRPMSLMERLAAKRQGLLTTPAPLLIVDEPIAPTSAPGFAVANAGNAASAGMCTGEAYGSFEPGNRWVESEGISGTTANIKLQVASMPSAEFQINAQFSVPVTSIEVWKFTAKRTRNQNLWVFTSKPGYSYDTNLDFTANILGETNDPNEISAIIVYCDEGANQEEASFEPDEPRTQRPVPGKDVLFNILGQGGKDAFRHQSRLSDQDRDIERVYSEFNGNMGKDTIRRFPKEPRCGARSPVALKPLAPRQTQPQCGDTSDEGKYDLKKVICLSRLFYQAQRVGFNPSNEIPWLGLRGLKHGCDRGRDLTGGWYDGGDNVVFVFPLAHTVTMLAWSIIDFPQAYQAAGEYKKYLKELKWGTDFLIKAHINEFEMVGLIGSPNADHKQWVRPDDPDAAKTPSFTITKDKSGLDKKANTLFVTFWFKKVV